MNNSFLNVINLNSYNQNKLLTIRKILLNSLAYEATKEKSKYLASLAVFEEFERLTSHVTSNKILKS
jgi:ribosomal protein L5